MKKDAFVVYFILFVKARWALYQKSDFSLTFDTIR